jgi:hypothetical protein
MLRGMFRLLRVLYGLLLGLRVRVRGSASGGTDVGRNCDLHEEPGYKYMFSSDGVLGWYRATTVSMYI